MTTGPNKISVTFVWGVATANILSITPVLKRGFEGADDRITASAVMDTLSKPASPERTLQSILFTCKGTGHIFIKW
ncbi:hypothetical protein [Paenibacillus amylolyticus]|uniref:hypothetical protein n=1 Tax=Paenibacillus amylolyticus TaxID=1451 RepID=UPI00249ABDED|nr:hypothetical protein [Paenibacillus amylolyticus]WFA84249.1 hypothetical protein OGI70_25415 [Paenibacillus amylolyticus]